MRGITLYQPYAFAVIAGIKRYETRGQKTNIRGRIFIHAGKKQVDAVLKDLTPETREKILALQHESPFCDEVLYRGGVIGTVEIVDCVPVESVTDTLTERERLLGDYSPGRFAWKLYDPRPLPTPIPAQGKQGWWEWDETEAINHAMQEGMIAHLKSSNLYAPENLPKTCGGCDHITERDGSRYCYLNKKCVDDYHNSRSPFCIMKTVSEIIKEDENA